MINIKLLLSSEICVDDIVMIKKHKVGECCARCCYMNDRMFNLIGREFRVSKIIKTHQTKFGYRLHNVDDNWSECMIEKV